MGASQTGASRSERWFPVFSGAPDLADGAFSLIGWRISVVRSRRRSVKEKRQSQTRLSDSNRCDSNRRELLAAYAVGVPVQDLAAKFEIHRSTVREVARRAGMDARAPALSVETREEAARLYEDGLTLVQVAERLGISDEAVRAAVFTCGGSIRPRGRCPA